MTRAVFLLWTSLGLVFSGCSFFTQSVVGPVDFDVKRGTNIGHWLSQNDHTGAARKAFFTERDVANIASLGFDHIRLPIDEVQMWDEAGQKDPEAFALLHQALAWCLAHRLRVIVDLHVLRTHHFNDPDQPLWRQPAARERFLNCWRELSAELKRYPVRQVAYELLNEPVTEHPEDWNALAAKAIASIRKTEPGRVIVVGPAPRQSAEAFDAFRVPPGDRNILLSFHYYAPFLLTHHQAPWTEIGRYTGPVHYPGPTVTEEELSAVPAEVAAMLKKHGARQGYDAGQIEKDVQAPLQFARRHGLRLYCGEWGTLSTVPAADRLRWYRDVRSVLEKNNIAWANWDYKSTGFGFTNGQGENYQAELIRALTGR